MSLTTNRSKTSPGAERSIDRRRSLAAVPVRSSTVEEHYKTSDCLVLIARFERRKGLFSRWLPSATEKKIELDDLGTFVFGLIDGQRTVSQIIEVFLQHYDLNHREAELSVVKFLRSLAEKRFIAIVIE